MSLLLDSLKNITRTYDAQVTAEMTSKPMQQYAQGLHNPPADKSLGIK